MTGQDYYIPAVALGIASLCKLPGLIRGWRNPMVLSANFLIMMAAVCFTLAAPPTISAVNRASGIPNFSGPLVYVMMCGFSCACVVLVENWLRGDEEESRRRRRAWIVGYSLVCVALITFFTLGEAPVERLQDLDTYYANTPWIREMITLYLLADIVAAGATTTICWRWARKTTGWLRSGLWVLVAGFTMSLLFGVVKLVAVASRWFDIDVDFLSTDLAPPLASVGAVTTGAGFLIPLIGPAVETQIRATLLFVRLTPLWHLVRPAEATFSAPTRSGPRLRLSYRKTAIDDAFLKLGPFLNEEIRQQAEARAAQEGVGAQRASAIGLATMLTAAVESRREGSPVAEDQAEAGRAALHTAAQVRDRDVQAEVARILTHPIVTEAAGQPGAMRESATR
ncbi:MAB_1171c family putative transporter [Streptomyces sp. NPDC127110]|uniref:MAB_1171c family putative transporter n=1 Tax=Streptomyces sp. NPDC127110 TaxID=3345362 RepID=UPI00362D138E